MKLSRLLVPFLFALLASAQVQAQSCGDPSNFAVTLNAGFSVHLAWDAVPGADSYNLQIFHDLSPDSGPVYNIPTASTDYTFIFSGYYNLRVQAVCGNNTGNWVNHNFLSPVVTQVPPPTCVSPSSFTETYDAGTNAIVISWAAMQNNIYNMRFKESTSGTWEPHLNFSGNSYSSTIQNCASYDYQVQHICGPGFFASWSATQTFTPQTAPNDLSTTNIGRTTATLNWTEVPGATYTVQYRRVGYSWITITGISGSPYNLTSLSKKKDYEWKVAAVCSGITGPYSAVESFRTSNYGAKMSETLETYTNAIQLVPNPAHEAASLRIVLEGATHAELDIYDMAGKRIFNQALDLEEGVHEMPLAVKEMENGVYFVTVSLSSGEKLVKKLVVVH